MRRAAPLLFAAWLLSAQTTKPPDAGPDKPVGSIHGVVKDGGTGAPLPDFNVGAVTSLHTGNTFMLIGSSTTQAITDSEGRYTLANVSAGSLSVTASDAKRRIMTQSVQLSAGQDLTLNFLIPGNPVISGRVLELEKQPAVDAFVWVIQSQYSFGSLRHTLIGPKVTGEDGAFTFDAGLEAGRAYQVVADRPLPAYIVTGEPAPLDQREPIEATTYYGDATSFEAAAPLVLRPGEHREQVEIKIRKAASYCAGGKVEASGKPASVLFAVQELPLAGTALTRLRASSAEDGTFRVCGLTPGQYRLAPGDSEGHPGAVDFAIANSDLHQVRLALEKAPLHLALAWDGDPPTEPEPVPSILRPPSQSTDDRPQIPPEEMRKRLGLVQGNEISVTLIGIARGTGNLKSESAPYDGPFGSEMPAGDYAVEVHLVPGAYVKEMTYNGVAFTDRLLRLAPGTSGTLRVVAAQGGATLTARVADADGKPVPGAAVLLIPEGATTEPLLSWLMRPSLTDGNGTSAPAALAPGKYRVLAVPRPIRPIPEDIDKLWLALSQAKEVELAPKDTRQVNLRPVSID